MENDAWQKLGCQTPNAARAADLTSRIGKARFWVEKNLIKRQANGEDRTIDHVINHAILCGKFTVMGSNDSL